jgi:hypothetical protein
MQGHCELGKHREKEPRAVTRTHIDDFTHPTRALTFDSHNFFPQQLELPPLLP